MDQFDTDAVAGCPVEMDLLGFVAELFVAPGDHGVYDHSDVFGGTGECGECFLKGLKY